MIADDVMLTPEDKKAIEKLASFLPDKIFDMHMHIGTEKGCPTVTKPEAQWPAKGDFGMDKYLAEEGRLFPNAKIIRANMIGMPDVAMKDRNSGCREEITRFIAEELNKHPECVAEILTLAGDTREDIEKQLIHPNIRGIKCYHQTAAGENTFQCNTWEFLPEAAWQVASERNLCITLHMVRDLALADPDNIDYICTMAAKYPKARLILAHAARGFAPWTVEENIGKLVSYENVYFDLSAVCEPDAMYTILKACGHKRVFWGSDYAVSMFRGKCVSVGPSFLWLYKEQLEACTSNTPFSAYLVGIEGLIALERASRYLDLTRQQVEDIFYNNAMEFFDLSDE